MLVFVNVSDVHTSPAFPGFAVEVIFTATFFTHSALETVKELFLLHIAIK